MATKRPRGTGTLRQRPNGTWEGRYAGRSVYGRTKTEASAKLAELVQAGPQAARTRSRQTVEAYLDGWLESKAGEVKPSTLAGYRSMIDLSIVPAIGTMRLADLTPLDVEQVEAYAVLRGRSAATARHAFRVMSSAFRDAERLGLIDRNPCHAAKAPRVKANPRPAIPPTHLKAIFEANRSDPYLTRFMLALFTAGRQGEILGLELDRLHLDGPAPYVELTRSLQRVAWRHGCGGEPCGFKRAGDCPARTASIPSQADAERVHGALWLLSPKSATSARPIALMPTMAAALRLWLEHARPERFVFEQDGHPIDPHRDWKAWRAMQANAGIAPPYPVHSLRHTAATLMAEAGISERIRVNVMGHSSADMTAWYTHREVAEQHAALGALEAGFAGIVGQPT